MDIDVIDTDDWVPASCTLPTVEQPLRRAEFDDLFAKDVVGVHETSTASTRFDLRAEPAVAARAATLATKETGCCSFFRFELTMTEATVGVVVSTEETHADVLAALTARARAKIGNAP